MNPLEFYVANVVLVVFVAWLAGKAGELGKD